MKFAIALGGLVGFGVVYVMALLAGKTPAESLFQASIGSIVVGILFRWVTSIWIRNVKQMLMEKHQTAVAAMVEAEERKRQEDKEQSAKPV